jgi:hypothetical protein
MISFLSYAKFSLTVLDKLFILSWDYGIEVNKGLFTASYSSFWS